MQRLIVKKSYIIELYSRMNSMDKFLLVSSLFSVLMVVLRAIVTGRLVFVFLPWNLFLAAVPYFISSRLVAKARRIKTRITLSFIFIAWMLFIPNSFYIITDLFHLKLREESSRWFDLTLIFSFAWNGLLFGILSFRQMERIMLRHFNIRHSFLFLLPAMWLIAFGIYIGRFMRFNSWDVLANPFELIRDVLYMAIHPYEHIYSWGMICCFGIFMSLIYVSVKRIAAVYNDEEG